jgi:hypothetical protein
MISPAGILSFLVAVIAVISAFFAFQENVVWSPVWFVRIDIGWIMIILAMVLFSFGLKNVYKFKRMRKPYDVYCGGWDGHRSHYYRSGYITEGGWTTIFKFWWIPVAIALLISLCKITIF